MKIATNLTKLRTEIRLCEKQFNREQGTVCLLAVSKTRTIDDIQAAIAEGQYHFGENYYQEAINKIQALHTQELIWHFIGKVQSNKTKSIAQYFDWVHTVDRIKIAQRLNEARPAHQPPLNICIQINISQESRKSGIHINDCNAFIKELSAFDRLKLRGFMTLPAPANDVDIQRESFAALRELFELTRLQNADIDTLSMGTSQDMTAAIAEGATIVRIGTALFGPRKAKFC